MAGAAAADTLLDAGLLRRIGGFVSKLDRGRVSACSEIVAWDRSKGGESMAGLES